MSDDKSIVAHSEKQVAFHPLPTHPRFVDQTGNQFGLLTVLGFAGDRVYPGGGKQKHWFAKCTCGNVSTYDIGVLKYRKGGCSNCPATFVPANDLVGQRFNQLTVVRFIGRVNDRTRWLCKCDCGNYSDVEQYTLINNKIKTCGCANSKTGEESHLFVHGLAGTYICSIWHAMLARCYNPSTREYKNYGGRGITVCERWRNSLNDFADDMGERPTPQHSIDRIDNDGNYEPSNCRWATAQEQNRNNRRTRWITHNNETLCLQEWANRRGLQAYTILARLKRGWSMARALDTPNMKA